MITGPFAENPFTKIPIFIGNPAVRSSSPERPTMPALQQPSSPPSMPDQPIPATPMTAPTAPDQDNIPIVTALPIPMAPPSAMEPTIVQAHAVVLGGTAVQSERDEPDIAVYDISDQFDFDNLVPLAPPPASAPSFDRLIRDMVASVNDYDMISQMLAIEEWKVIFANMQPAEYGDVILHISNDFDQPRIAVMVANTIRRFTCSHCIAALKSTADWNRTTVVVRLVPLCVDLQSEKGLVLAELSPWEQTVTASDFEQALRR
jgi:hypothetical protein